VVVVVFVADPAPLLATQKISYYVQLEFLNC
jgi:hypothetical protein